MPLRTTTPVEQFPRHRKKQFPSDVQRRVFFTPCVVENRMPTCPWTSETCCHQVFVGAKARSPRPRCWPTCWPKQCMFHDPNCEVCKLTKTKRTRCKNRPLKRADGISLPTTFGELTTADRKILNLDDGSRNDHQHAVIVQDGYSHLLLSNPTKKAQLHKKQHLAQEDCCLHFKSQHGSPQTI